MYDQAVIETHVEPGPAGLQVAPEVNDDGVAPGGDLLVEEVSIDGMCGVY